MALIVATTPPNLIVEATIKRRTGLDIFEEQPSLCDSVWACLLNDYLEDDATVNETTSRSVSETREDVDEAIKTKKSRKKKKKKRKSSKSHEKEAPAEPSLAGDTKPSLLEDDPILDDRDRENEGIEKKIETIDLTKTGIDLVKIDQEDLPGQDHDHKKTSQSVGRSPESETSPLNRDEKFKTSKRESLGRSVPEGDVAHEVKPLEGARKSGNEVFHYAPITPDSTSEMRKEGRNDSPRRSSRPSKSKPIPELDVQPSRSMQAQPEEIPSFGSLMAFPEDSVRGEVKVSKKPIVTRRPIKDIDKDKHRKRMPVDPDEEKSIRSLVSIKLVNSRSRSRSRSRGPLKPEEGREAEDDAGPVGGEGTPDDPIEIFLPRSPGARGHPRTYDESEISTGGDRKIVSNDRKSRERGKATSAMNTRERDKVDNDESLIQMLKESKKIDKDYRRRKLDRKEALHRIRAIKARLATADP
jgi:hypothetical protein